MSEQQQSLPGQAAERLIQALQAQTVAIMALAQETAEANRINSEMLAILADEAGGDDGDVPPSYLDGTPRKGL